MALVKFARIGDLKKMTELLDRKPDCIDARRYSLTPLDVAAKKGQIAAIELLVARGSKSINAHNYLRCNPIFHAASKGQIAAIDKLFELGATVEDDEIEDLETNNCLSPLGVALERGFLDTAAHLVKLGASSLDSRDCFGRTALHLAAESGNSALIEHLIQFGSRAIDSFNNDGETPLYCAVYDRCLLTVQTLIRLGSRAFDVVPNNHRAFVFPSEQAKNNNPALLIALKAGQTEIAKLLVIAGANCNGFEIRTHPLLKTIQEELTEEERWQKRQDLFFGGSLLDELLRELTCSAREGRSARLRRRIK